MSVKCGVCDTNIAKYKCPTCQLQQYVPAVLLLELDRLTIRSCSIECYKSHQTTHTDIPYPAASQSIPNDLPSRPPETVAFTRVSSSHFNSSGPLFGAYSLSCLELSADLQELHTRYPRLQDQLKEIYEAATKPLDDQLNDQSFSSKRGDRGQGRGRNKRRGRDYRTTATWSRHKGIKSGIHRLRILRHLKGEEGDGLREFSNLITGPSEAKKSTTIAPEV